MSIDPLVVIGVASLAIVSIAYVLKSDNTPSTSKSRSISRSRSRSRSKSLDRLSKESLKSSDSASYKTAVSRTSSNKTKKFKPKIHSV